MPWLRRRRGRAGPLVRLGAVAMLLTTPVWAQEVQSALLTLDQERLFVESAFGRAAIARERAATSELEQENKRIEAELVAEELALTELRKTLPAAEFAARAEAFDLKVEEIRKNQDAKARLLAEAREKDRQEFLRVAVPILGELLNEKQAVAIVDKQMAIISLSAIDVTDEAIAKVDAALAAAPDEPSAP